MNTPQSITRRSVLARLPAGLLVPAASGWIGSSVFPDSVLGKADPQSPQAKRVAAIVTVYRRNSHADVILGKILEGWRQDGGAGPALQLASMYVDQFPQNDLARSMAKKHYVPIVESIEEALTLGGNEIAVDGVLSIGEHGSYPWNEIGQHLYPRRRFFSEITDVLEKHGRVVPVFNDKHLSTVWSDAIWMYQRAKSMNLPLMAGSSIPVTFRRPDVSVPMGCEVEAAVGIGYGNLDSYGFHALELLQCLLERRRGAEVGVAWVQCLQGDRMWAALDRGLVRKDLFNSAWEVVRKGSRRDVRQISGENVALLLFQYRDGLQAGLFMLSGAARGMAAALKVQGEPQPIAIASEERVEPRYPHFAYLLKGIERMMHTGAPSYPVERTLLTGGILDRAMTSRAAGHQRLDTPELAIRYAPVDYSHAPHIDLAADPTR